MSGGNAISEECLKLFVTFKQNFFVFVFFSSVLLFPRSSLSLTLFCSLTLLSVIGENLRSRNFTGTAVTSESFLERARPCPCPENVRLIRQNTRTYLGNGVLVGPRNETEKYKNKNNNNNDDDDDENKTEKKKKKNTYTFSSTPSTAGWKREK